MAYYGAEGFNAEKDGPEYIITANNGFRAWRMQGNGRLISLTMQHEWSPGKQVCNCPIGVSLTFHPDPFPTKKCSHGFYAYYGENYYNREYYVSSSPIVNGIMEGWGRCVIGERGFRSQFGAITAFIEPFEISEAWLKGRDLGGVDPQDWVRANLEKNFPSVPIFPSVEQALAIIPLRGKPDAA